MPNGWVRTSPCVVLAVLVSSALVLPGCPRKPRRRGRRPGAKTARVKKAPRARAKKHASPAGRDLEDLISANEAAAVASLRQYLAAQNRFRRADHYGKGDRVYANPADGAGFPDLYRLPSGKKLELIDSDMARATSPANAKSGYWFVNVTAEEAGRGYDYVIDHGLCAVPARHGETGSSTFVVDVTGTIWTKDTGGKPVTEHAPLEEKGWVPCGIEQIAGSGGHGSDVSRSSY